MKINSWQTFEKRGCIVYRSPHVPHAPDTGSHSVPSGGVSCRSDLEQAQAVSQGMSVPHSSLNMLSTATVCGLKPTRGIFYYLLVNKYSPLMGGETEALQPRSEDAN